MLLLSPHILQSVLSQNLPLPPLPYDYNALEPHIDTATMKVHHLKHHATVSQRLKPVTPKGGNLVPHVSNHSAVRQYTDKLNGVLTKLRQDPENKHLAKMGIDRLLRHIDEAPESVRKTLRNAGGGYVNHDLFFRWFHPSSVKLQRPV